MQKLVRLVTKSYTAGSLPIEDRSMDHWPMGTVSFRNLAWRYRALARAIWPFLLDVDFFKRQGHAGAAPSMAEEAVTET